MKLWKFLAAACAALTICASAHAQVSSTRSSLESQTSTCLINNTTGLITEACVLSLINNIIASEVTQLDTSNILNGSGIVVANGGSSQLTYTAPAANVLAFLAAPSSANLLAMLTTSTGTGLNVFNNSPTFAGTITMPDATTWGTGGISSITDVALSTQGVVCNSSAGLLSTSTTGCANTIQSVPLGGTGLASYTTGQLLYASAGTTIAGLSDVATGQVLASGGTSTAPAYTANPAVTSVTANSYIPTSGHTLISSTAPTITSGCGGGSPSISASNGPSSFVITIGTASGSTCVLAMPTANAGWNCFANDLTTHTTANFLVLQTASSASAATLTGYSDIAGAATWVSGDKISVSCFAN